MRRRGGEGEVDGKCNHDGGMARECKGGSWQGAMQGQGKFSLDKARLFLGLHAWA